VLWLKEHKRIWRVFFLVMLVVAMFGPWSFDRIAVPLPNTCSFPSVRLDDVLCSSPLPMAWLLAEMPSQLTSLMNRLIAGVPLISVASELLYILLSVFLVLPFLSTSVLIRWEKRQRWSAIHQVALGLAAGTSLLVCTIGLFIGNWALWGAWLYTFLTAGLLMVEIFAMSTTR
jgi:hypothetical protein